MINEKYYRLRIRPEHWNEFLVYCGPEDYSSCQAQANFAANQGYAAFMICEVLYPELYTEVGFN